MHFFFEVEINAVYIKYICETIAAWNDIVLTNVHKKQKVLLLFEEDIQ